MEGWEKRLLEEKQDLDTKIRKLDAFFKDLEFEALPPRQHILLTQQYLAMKQYSDILALRINA